MFLSSVLCVVMATPPKPAHFIKAWREYRQLSLRQLASRMETEPGVELITYASLSRIENQKQSYTEDILNALAEALAVEPWMLLKVDPNKNGKIVDLLIHLNPDQQRQAIKLIEVLKAG